jgi:hypothetical protein
MTQRRVTATNQIATVIDVLQLGKKTGILTVERGEGETFEEGTLTFVNGQVVQAAIGPYSGRDAAAKLFSWQACRFLFVPMLAGQINGGMLHTPHTQPEVKIVKEISTGPIHGLQQSDPTTLGDPSLRPAITVYSKESMDDVLRILDQRGLSRAHRHLFLLIDRRRSIKELAAITGIIVGRRITAPVLHAVSRLQASSNHLILIFHKNVTMTAELAATRDTQSNA